MKSLPQEEFWNLNETIGLEAISCPRMKEGRRFPKPIDEFHVESLYARVTLGRRHRAQRVQLR